MDLARRVVRAEAAEGAALELPYDQLVVALGATTNQALIPGSDANALTFKTVADALVLRNHLIERLERADAARDAGAPTSCLTVVVVGGGLVGVELLGELTAFADDVVRYYPSVRRDELRFRLVEAGPRILPELPPELGGLGGAGARTTRRRHPRRDAGAVHRARAHTPRRARRSRPRPSCSPPASSQSPWRPVFPSLRDPRGQITVDATMRSVSHSEVWALGDCAAIPGPDGRPYPALAQHAIREARQLAKNLAAVLDGRAPTPFVFRSLGTMAALGHKDAVAHV